MDSLDIRVVGGDGAGGHSLTLIGLSLVEPVACELPDLLSLETPGKDVVVVEGNSFFPMGTFEGPLEPTQTVVIGVETVASICDTTPPTTKFQIDQVMIHFDDGTSRTVAVDTNSVCEMSWNGYATWG